MRWMRWFGVSVMVWAGMAGGQVLARRNWEGSGLTAQAWWARGVFCEGGADVRRVVGQMDALERMGCDAVEVEPGSALARGGMVVEMDALIEAAGRSRMRVVVDLVADGGGEAGLRERVGFWGARGVAGFAVRGAVDGVVGRLRQGVGGRLWIGEGSEGQLNVRRVPRGDAAAVRAGLAGAGLAGEGLAGAGLAGAGVLLAAGEGRLGYARTAMLLASGAAARVEVDAVLTPPVKEEEYSTEDLLLWVPKEGSAGGGMEDWVRTLTELRRGSASLRTGQAVLLNLDAPEVVGWKIRSRDGRTAVVVLCNVGERAVRVGVVGVVRGSSMRVLARSDGGVGGSLAGVDLGVDGVFVGEVR